MDSKISAVSSSTEVGLGYFVFSLLGGFSIECFLMLVGIVAIIVA